METLMRQNPRTIAQSSGCISGRWPSLAGGAAQGSRPPAADDADSAARRGRPGCAATGPAKLGQFSLPHKLPKNAGGGGAGGARQMIRATLKRSEREEGECDRFLGLGRDPVAVDPMDRDGKEQLD